MTVRIISLCLLAASLVGCDVADQLTPNQKAVICDALLGPIYYNTYNAKSGRYAAHVLALDLKQRNQVWNGLGCRVSK